MSSEPTQEALAAAARAMRARIATFALQDRASADGETYQIDARTAAVLENAGINGGTRESGTAGIEPNIIADSNHPDRARVPDGPLLFLRRGNGVIPLAHLVFDRVNEVRVAVLDYLAGCAGGTVATTTSKVLLRYRTALASGDRRVWLAAAVAVSDAICDDLPLNIAGVKQAIATGLDDAYREYLGRVLVPSVAALSALELPVQSPSAQRTVIESGIDAIVRQSPAFVDALDRYYRGYGYIPLGGSLAMSAMCGRWQSERGAHDRVWDDLWKWADRVGSPVARYHVCQVLVEGPELIPDGQFPRFWREASQVVQVLEKEGESRPEAEAWRVRCDLAKYFCHYIESVAPGREGERIAVLSWWLSERVAELYGADGRVLADLRESTITPQYERAAQLWQLVTPSIVPHSFRFATLFTSSVWSLSLQAQLGGSLARLKPEAMDSTDRDQIGNALEGTVLLLFPGQPEPVLTYAYEATVVPAAQAWTSISQGEAQEKLAAFTSANIKLTNAQEAPRLLDQLGKGNEADDLLIGQAFRVMAYLGCAPAELLWEKMVDEKWRSALFVSGRERTFALFIDALLQIQGTKDEKWRSHLPHFCAMACEETSSDRDRQKMLFACVLLSSIAGDTVSAIQRLLHGEKRHEFAEDVREWRERLLGVQRTAPGYVAAKIRPALAALHM